MFKSSPKRNSLNFPIGKIQAVSARNWVGTGPATNYFLTSVVVVVVAAGAAAGAAASVAVAAGATAPSAAGAAILVVSALVVLVSVVVVPAAGVSTVVDSVFFDSHDDRPAVRARPRAANLNRWFILGVILKMG